MGSFNSVHHLCVNLVILLPVFGVLCGSLPFLLLNVICSSAELPGVVDIELECGRTSPK